MFDWFKNMIRKGGAKVGMVESLNNITDHPKIAVNSEEYLRIQDNKRIYKNIFEQVTYASDDPTIATVTPVQGKVAGVKAGTANITVTTANGKTATCAVTVTSA